ncbi:YeeE/YedE family protein [Roseateles sp. BYS180W]|uniref:YeeE/YedE family protein n=1 Tax=Roseateles rivi TaxID=3299028 RepID=A0ABW7FX09_9BURK
MNIAWSQFTPWSALAGGVLLGLACAALVLLRGRILGVSGIVGGLLRPKAGDRAWRLALLAGLLAAAPTLGWLAPQLPWTAPHIEASYALVALAGLLVGWGTRLGSGCTSGHGVCGLARLSPRSLAATLSFMAAGFAVVYALRHLI